MNTRMLYGVDQTADLLSLSTKEVRRLVQRGELLAVSVGRRRLIPAGQLDAYIDRLEAKAGGQQVSA